MRKDYYNILGVDKNSTQEEIDKAYRRMVKKYHPDINKAADANKKMQEVNEAYDTLRDKDKRAQYDNPSPFGNAGASGDFSGFGGFNYTNFNGGGSIFEDIFENVFNMSGSGHNRKSHGVNGKDLQIKIQCTLEDVFYGHEQKISFESYERCVSCSGEGGTNIIKCNACNGSGYNTVQTPFGVAIETCRTCRGQGSKSSTQCNKCRGEGRIFKERTVNVKIPRGVVNDTTVKQAGSGEGGAKGGKNGDLYMIFEILPHKLFKRDGAQLITSISVTLKDILLGADMQIRGIDDQIINFKIDKLHDIYKSIKIKNCGMWSQPGSNTRGDLVINLNVKMPHTLGNYEDELKNIFNNIN